KKSFQLTYSYKARMPGIKNQIDDLILNSSGVRDTARVLGINKNTVISHLKKTLQVNPYLLNKVEVLAFDKLEISYHYTAEADEFWSYVGSKDNQRWTWYAMDKNSGIILAWVNGKRTDASFKKLLDLLKDTPIGQYYTDDWGAYSRLLSKSLHTIGKEFTWKIERKNLNFRTHIKRLNRKTICFSKNEKIHDNVIG
ncbi:MAG: IS1 family transposase, partial [Polaribacter sp.]